MRTIIPIYRKKVDIETGLPILDENGQEISEHVRDIIVEEPDPIPYIEPTPEEIEARRLEEEEFMRLIQSTIIEEPIENP